MVILLFCMDEQNLLLEEGQQYAVMLYTWRSCSRAFPQVRSLHLTETHLTPYQQLHSLTNMSVCVNKRVGSISWSRQVHMPSSSVWHQFFQDFHRQSFTSKARMFRTNDSSLSVTCPDHPNRCFISVSSTLGRPPCYATRWSPMVVLVVKCFVYIISSLADVNLCVVDQFSDPSNEAGRMVPA